MITISVVMSVILLFAGVVHLSLGVYAIFLDSSSRLNRVFFASTVSLFIWAGSFSVAIISPTEEIVMFWRRIAALGWGTFYALMVIFIIVLTRHKINRIGHKERGIPYRWLLFVPALICVYVFSISNQLTSENYNLVNTYYGWRNVSMRNQWDNFFNVYYIGYSILGIAMLLDWRRRSAITREKKQSTLIISTLLLAFVLGSTTDILLDYLVGITLPELGVVFLVIPIAAIWYSIKNYGFMALGPSQISEDLVRHMSDGLILLNRDCQIEMTNPAGLKMLGYDQTEIVGKTINSLIERSAEFNGSYFDFKAFDYRINNMEIIMKTKDSRKRQVLFSTEPIMDQFKDLMGIVCIFSDISDLIAREAQMKSIHDQLENTVHERTQELLLLNELQNILLEISTDFITLSQENFSDKIDSMFDKVGRFIGAERACTFKFDKENESIELSQIWHSEQMTPDLTPFERINSSDLTVAYSRFQEEKQLYITDVSTNSSIDEKLKEVLQRFEVKSMLAIPVETNKTFSGFITFDTVSKSIVWNQQEINVLKLLANILADGITRIESEQNINYLAYYDALTSLPNRIQFKRRLEEQMNQGKPLCIVFIDLDDFKIVNDTLGHSIGDLVLVKVAELLKIIIGKKGLLSRMGGDEFIAYIDQYKEISEVEEILSRIYQVFQNPIQVDDHFFMVSFSAGIAFYPEDGITADEIIGNADTAMYAAKESGKNVYQVCTPQIKEEIAHKSKLISNLQNAIQNGELELHYQPQVALESSNIMGFEALIRWNSPVLGNVSPGVFIPIAESHGIIGDLGDWVLEEVCRQIRRWQKVGLTFGQIGVNVSVQQLKETNFVEKVKVLLERYEILPEYLEFEVTESAAMSERYSAIDTLVSLREMGIEIAIDDFGSDYSSLRRLKELPIDRLKIDQAFIKDLTEDPKNLAILKAIISLAKDLELKLIAEGVETLEQIDLLKQYSCDAVQGYYFYKPLNAKMCTILLAENPVQGV